MSTLYHNNNTFVSTEVIEFDGQKYDPKELTRVFIVRHDEYGGILKGGGIAIIGIIAMFYGAFTFGVILLLGGGAWCAKNFYDNQDERVPITVSVTFGGGRHTGTPDNFIVHVEGTLESKKLEEALWLSKEG